MKNTIDSFLADHEQKELAKWCNNGVDLETLDDEIETAIIEANRDRQGYGSQYEQLVDSGLHPNLAAQLSRMSPAQPIGWNNFR